MIRKFLPFMPYSQFTIPTTFDECFTYEKQVLWLRKGLDSSNETIATMQTEIDVLKQQVADILAQLP